MHNHRLAMLLVGATGLAPLAHPRGVPAAPKVSINDNRMAAGVLRGHALDLRIVARIGRWYPNGNSAPGADVQAFAEEGSAPRIPGPMIRVRAGTEVSVTVRNAVPHSTLIVHGLTSRRVNMPVVDDSLTLANGMSGTVRIRLDLPGTYYYWGTTMGRTVGERTREDAQLTGAIIVDPAEGPVANDRVMVIGMWSDTAGHVLRVRERLLSVINGLTWPSTERLSYFTGDTIHWRIINASADSHPMHLHGFYFRVDSRGNGLADSLYARDERDNAVTDNVRPGNTMSMTWSPDRTGNWLFHCHLTEHIEPRGSLGMRLAPAQVATHGTMNHALTGMGGLVMGLTVRARPNTTPNIIVQGAAVRQLRLRIEGRPMDSDRPVFAFVLDDGRTRSASALAAPPIVLTRGEPVSITVVNTLSEASSVHWHGIELESYYDGVAGFSGTAARPSPVIAPGDSFVARFTPPRAGTFIYHTHVDELRQQPAGLAGPIIVLERGEQYDPESDITVVASAPHMRDSAGVVASNIWLNGASSPAPLALRAGHRYRLRLINISTNSPGLHFDLTQGDKLVAWRQLAKDGADLRAARQVMRPARLPVSIGETADVEFTPVREGKYQLEARLVNNALAGTMIVNVSP
ncbi:MAG: multicopper oxidase domain-containing protein [Gemmatimonadaceae bacterium]